MYGKYSQGACNLQVHVGYMLFTSTSLQVHVVYKYQFTGTCFSHVLVYKYMLFTGTVLCKTAGYALNT